MRSTIDSRCEGSNPGIRRYTTNPANMTAKQRDAAASYCEITEDNLRENGSSCNPKNYTAKENVSEKIPHGHVS